MRFEGAQHVGRQPRHLLFDLALLLIGLADPHQRFDQIAHPAIVQCHRGLSGAGRIGEMAAHRLGL